MRALIVDDEEDIVLMTRIILKNIQIESDHALTFSAAQEKILDNNYDLFLIDLRLPDGAGFDLIPLIRRKEANANIIIMSAYTGLSETQKAKEYEVASFINKPFTKKEIYNAVNDLI